MNSFPTYIQGVALRTDLPTLDTSVSPDESMDLEDPTLKAACQVVLPGGYTPSPSILHRMPGCAASRPSPPKGPSAPSLANTWGRWWVVN